MRDRVREILSWYRSEYPGVLTTLFRLVSHGRLGGTGQLVIFFSGRSKTNETAMLDEVRAICADGGFGSIIGRGGTPPNVSKWQG
ncbi:MAG: hypothetical protein KF716_22570 [Anaerolineae bacterium]|nr:hypothetical protein [Anaerolineae bacterium]